MLYKMSGIVIVLWCLMTAAAVIPNASVAVLSVGGDEATVFLDYILPDGDLWTSAGFPVEVCLSDPNGISMVYLQVAENDMWVRWPMREYYHVNESVVAYDFPHSGVDENNTSAFPFRVAVPAPGVTDNYTFRFEANDMLGNVAYTDNITTSVYRGEGPLFVAYEILDEWTTWCSVEVADDDGIDTVQLHIWDPHTELWSTEVMLYEQDTSNGVEYVRLFNVTAPVYEPPQIYRFKLESNDTLGNSVVSCEMSRVYHELITTVDTTTGTGFPLPPETLAVIGLVAGCIAVIVILHFRRRP